jgi:hypothetical protein
MAGIALIFLLGVALSVVVVVWDRHDEVRRERRRSGWLASFYERESPRVRK